MAAWGTAPKRESALDVGNSNKPPTIVEELVRRLVTCVCPEPGPDPPRRQEDAQEIVLDTQVDGVRYLVVRLGRAFESLDSASPREHEIVRMVAEGHPNKVIAGVLNISPWTVCTHLRRIFAKIGVNSRAALVAHLLEIRASRDPSA